MPIYEYVCLDCKEEFSETKPIAAYEPGKAQCPKFKGKNVDRRWTSVNVTTSKKS